MQRKSFLDGNTFLRLPLRNPTSNNISRYGTGQHLNSFHFIPFRSISFHFIPFHSISFHFIPFHSISFHFIPFLSFMVFLSRLFKSTTTQKRSQNSTNTVPEFHAEGPQATASEGLAQGPYVAARAGFEPATLRTIGVEP